MPELPEVETIVRQLRPGLIGRRIVDAGAFDHEKFLPALESVGRTFTGLRRRGKFLIAGLGAPTGGDGTASELVIHLGMTGQLGLRRPAAGDGLESAAPDPYVRARWELDDGSALVFRDVRRFGRIAVVAPGDYGHSATLAAMGPEPFDVAFDADFLRTRTRGSSRAIKTQLLSQRLVAGVGNIYADEALWAARVHPRTRQLTRPAAERLVRAIREVLTAGIEAGGTTLRDYRDASGDPGSFQLQLRCYGRAGEPCDRCGTPLRRVVVDARSTTFCTACQRR